MAKNCCFVADVTFHANYLPVSILQNLPKVFERCLYKMGISLFKYHHVFVTFSQKISVDLGSLLACTAGKMEMYC